MRGNWREHAACAGRWDLFFDVEGESTYGRLVREATAITLCRSCPSRLPCLEWALGHPSQHGIFGGVTEDRRKALRHAWLERQQRGETAA